jgi:Autographiviridae endonuclease VII
MLFKNGRAGQQYADPEHRQRSLARRRHWQAKRYWEDPNFRQRKLKANRTYRAANREEINRRLREKRNTDEYREKQRVLRRAQRRMYDLKTKYGMSVEDYDAMLLRQGGVCSICKRHPRQTLIVDHCHKTRKVRGLLCHKCNVALGFYHDDPRLTREATVYLEASLSDEPG